MDQTGYKGIPYPSEYEDPFFESFENMMNFLDVNTNMVYTSVSGWTASTPERIDFIPNEAIDHVAGSGCPIRYRAADLDPWRYGLIRAFDAAGGTCYVVGAELQMDDVQFQVGDRSMVQTVRAFFPGNYNSVAQNGLFWNQRGQGFVWNGPRAYAVKLSVVNRVNNGGGSEYVNLQRNSSRDGGGSYSLQTWRNVVSDYGGNGIVVQNNNWNHSDFVYTDNYEFRPGDIFDFCCLGSVPNDAEDLTVEAVFVYRGDQDQLCAGQFPQTTLTISGMPEGKDWQGLGNGVHQLCPSYYTTKLFLNPGLTYSKSERWAILGTVFGFTGDALNLAATYHYNPYSTASLSRVTMSFFNGSTQFWSTIIETDKPTGFIKNRLFTTFVIDGVTFTLSRGPGTWAYEGGGG